MRADEDDLRARVRLVLSSAGIADRDTQLPVYGCGGAFSAIGESSTGINVFAEWWDASADQLEELRRDIAATLDGAGFELSVEEHRLYVHPDRPAG